jgi:hypothetical protein
LNKIKEADEVGLTMRERQSVTREIAGRYQKARKKEKGRILDEFVRITGYSRCYAAYVLRTIWRKVRISPERVLQADPRRKPLRKRQKSYGPDEIKALTAIWFIMDCICGKRLVAIIPEVLPRLERCGELKLRPETKQKLLTFSAATIDRILSGKRKEMALKGRCLTKPGSLLKSQIPIHTFSDWNETKPGFVEIDLVGHDGGNASGEFIYTLDVTDVATGWVETQAVKNKAQKWVFEALQDIRRRLPFPLLGIDSDNGSEFINHHLYRYCKEEKITFTRARSYRKNDNCFVEQKNYSVVRRNVGYGRYDTPQHQAIMDALYRELRLYTNFFQPSMKLIQKTRIGSKVIKQYDAAQTPYRRLLASPDVSTSGKRRLTALYAKLNPAALKRCITALQQKLSRLKIQQQKNKAA